MAGNARAGGARSGCEVGQVGEGASAESDGRQCRRYHEDVRAPAGAEQVRGDGIGMSARQRFPCRDNTMTQSLDFQTPLDNRPLIGWTPFWRAVVFVLSAMSIWCLLVDFYSIVSMRVFTLYVFVPAAIVLVALAASDGFVGTKTLLRNVIIGAIAGFVAALSYDVFRLPFVFARQWHIASVVPPMPLFKVFPAFGQMIL